VRRILANAIPDEVALEQNYPNPFNPSTVIEYAVPDESFVKLTIFNIIGQEVATLVNETLPAGYHSASWNASNVNGGAFPSGIYIYRLNATSQISGEVSTRSGKMQLMK
jgi:flagellar hook assembly protein FlgD